MAKALRLTLDPRSRLTGDRHASAAVEFAFVAPVFLAFLGAILGLGVDGLLQFVLDDAVRDAARQVQINAPAAAGGPSFVAAVCSEFGLVAADCNAALTYSVKASTATAGFTPLTIDPLDGSGRLGNSFYGAASFGASVPVLVQVAYPLPFTIPFVSTLITWTGANSLRATAAIRTEPF